MKGLLRIVVHWLISSVAVLVAAYLLPGVAVESFATAFVTAAILGVINAFIRPVLLILTLPITIVTLGLFALVINALLVMVTGAIAPGFSVASFWWALLFSVVLTLVNSILHAVGDGNPSRHSHPDPNEDEE